MTGRFSATLRGASLAAVLAAAALAPAAHAQRVSPMKAGRLMQLCASSNHAGQEVCDAYITGMADSFALVQKLRGESGGSAPSAGVCVPENATGAAMRGHVVAWARGHRQMMGKQVGEVVYQALHESYPCGAG